MIEIKTFIRGRDTKSSLELGYKSKEFALRMMTKINDYLLELKPKERRKILGKAIDPAKHSFDDWRFLKGYSYDEALKEIRDYIENSEEEIRSLKRLIPNNFDDNFYIRRLSEALRGLEIYKSFERQALKNTGVIMFKNVLYS